MAYWRLLSAVLLALGTACAPVEVPPQTPTSPSQSPVPPPAAEAEIQKEIVIATFNLDQFGPQKSDDPEILGLLAQVIRQFDVVAVQEITDQSGQAPTALLNAVNQLSEPYGMALSARTGQQADDSNGSAQEQYAFYYRERTIEPIGDALLYPDDQRDLFQREPYIGRFKAKDGELTFVLINIHTDPDLAVQEIDGLHQTVEWARSHFADEDDFIILGDFNADCNYANPEELRTVSLRQLSYAWAVQDEDDTTVAESSCAYDRIVLDANAYNHLPSRSVIYRLFDNSSVSDHWPVAVNLKIGTDLAPVLKPDPILPSGIDDNSSPAP